MTKKSLLFVFFIVIFSIITGCGPVDKWPIEYKLEDFEFSIEPENCLIKKNEYSNLKISFTPNKVKFECYRVYIDIYPKSENTYQTSLNDIFVYEESDLINNIQGKRQVFYTETLGDKIERVYKLISKVDGEYLVFISIYADPRVYNNDIYTISKKYFITVSN